MKKIILITVVLTIMTVFFGVCSHAAIEDCDFSDPKDGYIDGGDLAQFAAYYAVGDPAANVDGVGDVDSDDVAHFAGFYGGTYAISARRPNILLIIADDIGIDVTTDMYPGLITDLLALYGPEGHDNPNYLNIDGNPASTPVLNGLAQEGMSIFKRLGPTCLLAHTCGDHYRSLCRQDRRCVPRQSLKSKSRHICPEDER